MRISAFNAFFLYGPESNANNVLIKNCLKKSVRLYRLEQQILIQRLSNQKRLAGSNVKGGPTAVSGHNGPLVHP